MKHRTLRTAAVGLCIGLAVAAVPAQPRRAAPAASAASAANPPPLARLDLNAASVDELARLPGMNERHARKVVKNRPYQSVRQLLDDEILPSGVYDAIRNRVEVKKP